MRRLMIPLGILVLVLALAPAATASPPTKTSVTIDATGTAPAGTRCDFTLHQEGTITLDRTDWSNGRYEVHSTEQVTFTNLDTGQVITGRGVGNAHGDSSGEHDSGLVLQLRDSSGKLVFNAAGRSTWVNVGGGTLLLVSATPNSADGIPAICSALGGNAA